MKNLGQGFFGEGNRKHYNKKNMKFKNKTVLITGGSNGIGKSIAQKFKKEGASVIIFDIVSPKYDVQYFEVDIRKEEQIKNAISKITNVDILVNNAGVYFHKSIETTTTEELDFIIDINIKGTYLVCKNILPKIVKKKGNIINIASILGQTPEPSSPAYCSSKAAILMLTKCLAQEYAKDSVRVNAILPGAIKTKLLNNSINSKSEEKNIQNRIPLQKIGSPEDVANLTIFLASDEATYITGGMYSIDGGVSGSSIYTKN